MSYLDFKYPEVYRELCGIPWLTYYRSSIMEVEIDEEDRPRFCY